jgi:hypothetical protein
MSNFEQATDQYVRMYARFECLDAYGFLSLNTSSFEL